MLQRGGGREIADGSLLHVGDAPAQGAARIRVFERF
jgi:hypothetical protein